MRILQTSLLVAATLAAGPQHIQAQEMERPCSAATVFGCADVVTDMLPYSLLSVADQNTWGLPLRADTAFGGSFWTQGHHYDLGMETDELSSAPEGFEGYVKGSVLGADMQFGRDFVYGISFNQLGADMQFVGAVPGAAAAADGDEGAQGIRHAHETYLSGFHPYFGWRARNGGTMWGSFGYDRGDVEVAPLDKAVACPTAAAATAAVVTCLESDIEVESFALGWHAPLGVFRNGDSRLQVDFVGSGVFSKVEEDADDGYDAEVSRVRLGFKVDYRRPLDSAPGGYFSGSAQLAYRGDFGDGLDVRGTEFQAGFDLAFATGMRFDFKARTLLDHDEVDEWGVAGALSWTGNAAGRPLEVYLQGGMGGGIGGGAGGGMRGGGASGLNGGMGGGVGSGMSDSSPVFSLGAQVALSPYIKAGYQATYLSTDGADLRRARIPLTGPTGSAFLRPGTFGHRQFLRVGGMDYLPTLRPASLFSTPHSFAAGAGFAAGTAFAPPQTFAGAPSPAILTPAFAYTPPRQRGLNHQAYLQYQRRF